MSVRARYPNHIRSELPSPGGGSHEPPGYTRFFEHNFTTPLYTGAGAWDADVQGKLTNESAQPNLSHIAGTIMAVKYPAGHHGGGAPCNVEGWDDTFEQGTEKREVYWRGVFLPIGNGVDFEAYPGTNKWGFFGYGDAPGGTPNHLCPKLHPADQSNLDHLPEYVTEMILEFEQQNHVSRTEDNLGTLVVGAGAIWTTWEFQLVLNTLGQDNGILRWWQNGELVCEKLDMRYIIPGFEHGFYHYRYNPTYGGGDTLVTKTRDDYILWDSWYMSGIDKAA